MIAGKLKFMKGWGIECQESIDTLENINIMREVGDVIEIQLLLSNERCVNIIKFMRIFGNTGLYYLVTVNSIDGVPCLKSIMFEDEMKKCIDYGVCTYRIQPQRLTLPILVDEKQTDNKFTKSFTLNFLRTCDIVSDYMISLNYNKNVDYPNFCDVQLMVDNKIRKSQKIELDVYQPIWLNMMHHDAIFFPIQLIFTFECIIDVNDIVITLGETFLNSELRRQMCTEKFILREQDE